MASGMTYTADFVRVRVASRANLARAECTQDFIVEITTTSSHDIVSEKEDDRLSQDVFLTF